MCRHIALISLALAGLAAAGPAAMAAEGFDNCSGFIDSIPTTITTQGVWCMRSDLSSSLSSGNLVVVATNNVTIDCNHFKLGGLGGGAGTTARGITATGRLNLAVRNCNIRGFFMGVETLGGGGHLVEDNRFESNRFVAASLASPGSMIRNNLIMDTGATTVATGGTFGIAVGGGVDVLDNSVNGISSLQASTPSYGIYANDNGNGAIVGNRVRGIVAAAGGVPRGIWSQGAVRTVISGNTVAGNGAAGGVAISCTDGRGSAFNNNIAGFATPVAGCTSSNNFQNPN